MNYTVKIDEVKPYHDQASNADVLGVTMSIKKGTKTEATKSMNFPLDTPEKDIKAAVQKYVDTYAEEQASKSRQEEKAKAQDSAQKVAANLTGTSLTVSGGDARVTKKK